MAAAPKILFMVWGGRACRLPDHGLYIRRTWPRSHPGIDRLCLVLVVTLIARIALVVTRFGVAVVLLDADLIRLA